MNLSTTVVLEDLLHPDSDGQPMAENTLQFDWIFKIVGELREMFAGQNVFVAGDLLWYPEEKTNTRQAPDALVVFGRPPGYRGSYRQWEEEGIPPHVVFEVLSPSNTEAEMEKKLRWYEKHGVEEYYFIDPYKNQIAGWLRREDGRLWSVIPMAGHVSPRLGIRFDVNGEVVLYRPDGREFQDREDRVAELEEELQKRSAESEEAIERVGQAELQVLETARRADEERERADQELERAEQERAAKEQERAAKEQERAAKEQERAAKEQERAAKEQERAAKELLAAKLRELGVNPEDVLKNPT